MFYYEVKPGSEVHKDLLHDIAVREKWHNKEITRQMNKALGFDIDKANIALIPSRLLVEMKPKDLEGEFCRRPNSKGFYEAKKQSRINTTFQEICRQYGLETPSVWRVINLKHNLNHFGRKKLYKFGDRFFLEIATKPEADFLQEISRIEFMEIQLEHERKKKEVKKG